MSIKFQENRNLYHTFSRVAIQEGQSVAAAVNKTGHTVTTNDVWTDIDKLPKNTTYFGNANRGFTDLLEVYNKNSAEFSKYVKLYDMVELSPVDGSGQDEDKNQAWELLIDGKRVTNFIAPTDVFDSKGKPCNGYTLKLFQKDGKTQIAPTDGNWAFDYVAGLVIFEREKTPQDMGWAGTKAGAYIKMSAWAYVGGKLTAALSDYQTDITTINKKIASLDVAAGADELISSVLPLSGELNAEGVTQITPVQVVIGTSKDSATGEETHATTTLSGTISAGVVTALVPYEVITVKEGKEQIYPDVTEISGIYNIVADYGTAAAVPISWSITFRV